MPRLPIPGSEEGSWGQILNDYLSAAHKSDGTLKNGSIPEAALDTNLQTKVNAIASQQGATGPTGPQGSVGATGPQGIPGTNGATGPQGPIGTNGATGATGPQGPQGEPGPAGTQGATGPAGTDGSTGPQGPSGATGPQGSAGSVGATGATGPQGSSGATGPQGTAGAVGATGSTGGQGATGPKGDQGDGDLMYPFFMSGAIHVAAGQSRIYLESSRTVAAVRAAVGTAPTGASIIVDVLKNGTSIYASTPANRPTITAGNYMALGGTPDTTSCVAGDYITVSVLQVGSGVAGSDLTIAVRLQ